MTCFLIDDDADDREIFRMALQALDSSIELVTASNGTQALEKLNSEDLTPDYIFLDLNMPYMSGKECLIRMREIKRLKNIPIILCSAIQYFEELTSYGASGFITKQNSVPALTLVLAAEMKLPKKSRELH